MRYTTQTRKPGRESWFDSVGTDDLESARRHQQWSQSNGEESRVVQKLELTPDQIHLLRKAFTLHIRSSDFTPVEGEMLGDIWAEICDLTDGETLNTFTPAPSDDDQVSSLEQLKALCKEPDADPLLILARSESRQLHDLSTREMAELVAHGIPPMKERWDEVLKTLSDDGESWPLGWQVRELLDDLEIPHH